VSLAAYGTGTVSAQASVAGDDEIHIDAAGLPALRAGDHYEVWLTDATRTVTVPVGALDVDRTADLHVDQPLVDNYSAIEVSVQTPANGESYSGVSVLRGNYR
jgi:hypothetical protein